MHTSQNESAIHQGNYYTVGAIRVLSKLTEMGIAVPAKALEVEKPEGGGEYLRRFTHLELALLDWFEGRDYDQAQALIHFRPPSSAFHIIRILNVDLCPDGISYDMLCPTRAEAMAAIISACDRDGIGLDAFRQVSGSIVAVIGGEDAMKIEAVNYEPFDIAIRDRVRTALKGVRQYDRAALQSKAANLPGLADISLQAPNNWIPFSPDSCMLLGFPGNWARAMRSALEQVGIIVKQSQAQELAAVYFGANSWHQLVKHQNELHDGLTPVAIAVETAAGREERFYHTTEEAFFAIGNVLRTYPEPVIVQDCSLSMDKFRIVFTAATRSAIAAVPQFGHCEPCIACGTNDYWRVDPDYDEAFLKAAEIILRALGDEDSTSGTTGLLYESVDPVGILGGMLQREEQPSDQVVQFDEHAVAILHVPDPNGGTMLTARARIYRVTEGQLERLDEIAMYKAETEVIGEAGATRLVIRPNYGRGKPIEIPFTDKTQVSRLMELTHRAGEFALTVPLSGQ